MLTHPPEISSQYTYIGTLELISSCLCPAPQLTNLAIFYLLGHCFIIFCLLWWQFISDLLAERQWACGIQGARNTI